MRKRLSFIILMCLLILSLSACGRSADLEASFDVISELCKSNFAPSSQEEYQDLYNKYKDTCISDTVLSKYLDIGNKTVHTNVSLTNYSCKYYARTESGVARYEASMRLSNNTVYTDVKVVFYVDNGKIINVLITES
jgi:hypothetical protein